MNKTVILHMRNLKADLTDKQIADNIRGLLNPGLLVDIRVVDEPSVADKPSWLKGNSDVEWSYNVIAEWLSSDIMPAATKPDRDGLAVLQALIYDVLTTARQAAAQDAYERAARKCEDLVTFTEAHEEYYLDENGDRCAWCIVLETAAAAIRALAAAAAGKEGDGEATTDL
jgi:hypothetical protein